MQIPLGVNPAGSRHPSGAAAEQFAICTVGELFGGVERHVLGMISELVRRGIAVRLILFCDGELAAQARAINVAPLILPASNLAAIHAARRLARDLERHAVRVVHAHGYKATVLCAIARRWYPFALVQTEHGLLEPSRGALTGWRERLYHWLDDLATRAAGATVCYVTEDLRAARRRAHAGLRTSVVANGVENMDRGRQPRPAEYGHGCFNVASVGRLEPVKALHLAIDALSAHDMPENVHLHVVGTGSSESDLRSRAQAVGVAARVHLLGFRRNARDYIAHCDTLIMPSLHEGLPYTLLEAMALGTSIIASRVGGLAEAIQDGVTGLLVPPGDGAALAQAIVRLHRDADLRSRLGSAARQAQRARFSLDTMATRYLELYQELQRPEA